MSILINGMGMPTSCYDCPLCYDMMECSVADIKFFRVKYQGFDFCSGRHPKCPLVPVPPHGRLIDADAVLRRYDYELSRTYNDDFAKGFQLGVKAAVGNGTAVVIEAEEGET